MPDQSTQIVLGGAGFLGSHLCEHLVKEGHVVYCIDNLVTGSLTNLRPFQKKIQFLRGDAAEVICRLAHLRNITTVWNLAALASPVAYFDRPLETAWAGAEVHRAALQFATDHNARFVFTSTSEVYGDPAVHPQPETYWGNVNSAGLRACYDESKRYGEALAMIFYRQYGLDVRIARLFNTYGPRMASGDGRMVPAFLTAALKGSALPVHGDGKQTRSMCYVDDTIDGLLSLGAVEATDLPHDHPIINIGNPEETSVLEIAVACWRAVYGPNTDPQLVRTKRHPDDPNRRCPDISRARNLLGWSPKISLEEGLKRACDWFRPPV